MVNIWEKRKSEKPNRLEHNYNSNDRIVSRAYNGKTLFSWIYDTIGNVASHTDSVKNVTYKYNSDGIRTSKTIGGVTTKYYIEVGNIAWRTDSKNTSHYTYDADGNLVCMNLN